MQQNHSRQFIIGGAAIGLLVVCLVWGGIAISNAISESNDRKEKIRLAKEMIKDCQECPEEALPDSLHKTDPWGNDLMVKYNDGFLKSITIISCGPDGKPNTKDDITGNRHVKLDWKAGGDAVGEAGGDTLQGMWRGLKRSFVGEDKKEEKK